MTTSRASDASDCYWLLRQWRNRAHKELARLPATTHGLLRLHHIRNLNVIEREIHSLGIAIMRQRLRSRSSSRLK